MYLNIYENTFFVFITKVRILTYHSYLVIITVRMYMQFFLVRISAIIPYINIKYIHTYQLLIIYVPIGDSCDILICALDCTYKLESAGSMVIDGCM